MHQEGSGVQKAWLCFCNLIVAACEEHGALAEASRLKVRRCSTMRLAFQSPFISQFRATFLLACLPSSVQLNLVSSAAEWGRQVCRTSWHFVAQRHPVCASSEADEEGSESLAFLLWSGGFSCEATLQSGHWR